MKYQVIAKIVGPYLPDNYSVAGMSIIKEEFNLPEETSPASMKADATEQHLIEKGVTCRIRYNRYKFPYKKFDSSHLVKVEIDETSNNPYEAYNLAKIKIQQLVESLTIASFNIDKIRKGLERDRNTTDIYQYQIMGIYTDNGGHLKQVQVNDFSTGVNYFPEEFPANLGSLTEEILGCNEETLLKAMEYMKRAKAFSFEYYSDLEVFLNSMKCVELFAKKFYPEGLRKADGKFVSFKDRVNGFDGKPGLIDILDIDAKYRDVALEAWDCRNQLDMAHASEYFKLIAFPFPNNVNEAAYHFLMKYVLYLKANDPNCFWKIEEVDDEWWKMFR